MKTAKKIALSIFTILLSCFILVGCTKSVGDAESLHSATERNIGKTLEITQDFTVSKDDKYFMYLLEYSVVENRNEPGRSMKKSKINGNGHTITIVGEDSPSTIGNSTAGFFYKLTDCTLSDLNIVYDTKVSMKAYGNGDGFGGLVSTATNCTFINCTVTYKTPLCFNAFPDRYGYNGRRVGGFIGSGVNCKFENCGVYGDIDGLAGDFGGFAGSLSGDSVLNRCTFNGKLNTYSLEGCNVGGLVGYLDGSATGCKVYLTGFNAVGEPQAWRNNDACVGGIVGSLGGNGSLKDSYLEFAPAAAFSISNKLNGLFGTEMHSGIVAGHALVGSSIERVYVNADTDFNTNILSEDDIALGLFNGEGNISQVFFVESSFNIDCEETVNVVIDGDLMSGYHTEFEIDGIKIMYSILTKRNDEDVYHVTDAELVIAGERITLRHKDITTVDSVYLFFDTVGVFHYSITLDFEASTLTFKRTHNKIGLGGATVVEDFTGIDFKTDGAETPWKYDENGKPYIEGLE